MTKKEILEKVKKDFDLLPDILNGIFSTKASIRYGCAKVLQDLSEEQPDKLYQHIDFFFDMLNSKYRILTWNALIIIANLTKVDVDNKFDLRFDDYFSLIDNDYMVTVTNLVINSRKIAIAKPYLTEKITKELLKVNDISITPHLTEECKRVICEKTIKSFDTFFRQIEDKDKVISFVKKHRKSSRISLKNESENFIKKWV